ncbi:HBR159Wp [Eremothecium sinecaudum]|uniref:HBR159Wp n=1 Tax=Eremothecium sinecaudum TaxID=45286 RepID=A0A125RE04_9SACH|nr:HBR159Wp [Eremothecium sinecaudum]AMD19060.1 HBR159Wp [Eremothecium sinecaudum]
MSSFSCSVPSSIVSNSTVASDRSERKRRDNINDRIQELLNVIPEEFFQEYYQKRKEQDSEAGTPIGGAGSLGKTKGTGTRDGKPNKGQILTQAVEYVMYLQNQVDMKNREEVELILKVKELNKLTGTVVNDINLENTSAEVALAKIGVGPLVEVLEEYYGSVNNSNVASKKPRERNNNFEYGGYAEYANDV